MGKLRELFDGWVLKIALKKAAKAAAGVVVSIKVLEEIGFKVDAMQLETWLIAAGSAIITVFLNWLKVKTKLGAKFL